MRFYSIIILLFINITVFAQQQKLWNKLNKRVGIAIPVDYLVGFEWNLAYMDKNSTNIPLGYFAYLFNSNVFAGIYYEQKTGVTKAKTTRDYSKYLGGNLRYHSLGIYVGKYFVDKKFKNNIFKLKQFRLNGSIKSGLGRDWILDEFTSLPLERKDYLLIFIPSAGIEIPLGNFISLGFSLNYHIVTRIDIYYSQHQLSGYGGNVSIRFSVFNNPLIKVKSKRLSY
jgi:hypothetical protein